MASVFVPGIGSDGPGTWPAQAGKPALARAGEPVFLTLGRARGQGAAEHAEQILALDGASLDLVAHSYGGIAALLAAARSDRVTSLVLFEPACMSVAPQSDAVRTFVAAMAPVWDRADNPALTDGELAGQFLVEFGWRRPPRDDVGAVDLGRRLRDAAPAWAFDIDTNVCARVPTLVVTGGWHPIYEDIAAALEAAGAERATIPGTEHRPQDAPSANALVTAFWRAIA